MSHAKLYKLFSTRRGRKTIPWQAAHPRIWEYPHPGCIVPIFITGVVSCGKRFQSTGATNHCSFPKKMIRGTQPRFPPKYIGVVFLAFHSTLTSLEMHSKGRYKNCTCSVILGELESFRNYKGFSIILQKIFDAT